MELNTKNEVKSSCGKNKEEELTRELRLKPKVADVSTHW